MKLQDDILLGKLAKGDASALEKLYVKFAPKIRAFITNYLGESTAEDLTHDLFLKLWKFRDRLRHEGGIETMSGVNNLDSYMFRMAKNSVMDYLKHQKIEQKYTEAFIASHNEEQDSRQEDRMDNRTMLANVRKQIEQLTDQQRLVFNMNRNEGKSYAEISKELGISEKTVQYHISTVLHKLKRIS